MQYTLEHFVVNVVFVVKLCKLHIIIEIYINNQKYYVTHIFK